IMRFRQKIIDGMLANGYTQEFAEPTFQQIQGFGEYGFPESHSASFALLVYVSCGLKRYHPAVFCCAILNSQPMGFYAPAQLVRDAREHGVTVLPADVNKSDWDCTLEENTLSRREREPDHSPHKCSWGSHGPSVRVGFRQIKGFREADARTIETVRQRAGRFESSDQSPRLTHLSRKSLERLAEADAFGSLG